MKFSLVQPQLFYVLRFGAEDFLIHKIQGIVHVNLFQRRPHRHRVVKDNGRVDYLVFLAFTDYVCVENIINRLIACLVNIFFFFFLAFFIVPRLFA